MKHTGLFFIPSVLVLTLSSCNNAATEKFYVASRVKKTTYNVGESFTLNGLRLINYRTGSEIEDYSSSISEGYVFTVGDVGNKTVVISKPSYENYTFDISITNYDPLVVSASPINEFYIGDHFSSEGLVVTCNGEEITGYTLSYSSSFVFTETGEYEVTVSKEGYLPTTYSITVYSAKKLFVSSLPTKTTYDDGDAFSSEGLVVKDEKNNAVTDYSLSIEDGTILKGTGEKTIHVTKEEYEGADFTITVNEKGGGEAVNHTISIYYVNDTHGSYVRDLSRDEGGMAYISKYIKDRKNEYTVVLSGGDMFQGGYESNETHGQIMIDAMNEIGFDTMVVGNHEFDWGESYFETYKESLNCPMISSTIFYANTNTRPSWCQPYEIIDLQDIRIGIIGGAQENLGNSITGSISENFSFPAPNSYIQHYSTELRKNLGCDVIIAAFHDEGYSSNNSETEPAKFYDLTTTDPETGLKFVDAMFFAHDHYRKNGTYCGVPYIEAGCNGKNLGIMNIDVSKQGSSCSITDFSTDVIWTDTQCTEKDSAFTAIETKYQALITKGDEVLYTFKKAYSSDEFTTVVCMAMLWYVNSHKEDFDGTEVSAASHNKGGVRDDIDKGDLKMRYFIKAFPFDNYFSIQTSTSYHVSNYQNSNSYVIYGTPTYDKEGHTKIASINYITERYNARYYQLSYINYDFTVKEAVYLYLTQKINPNL